MKAGCVECGKTPDGKSWKNFTYYNGDFYCSSHIPKNKDGDKCQLCFRSPIDTEEHHLIPKSKGGERTVSICSSCHRRIHSLFTNGELARKLNTLEKLRKMPEIENYLNWIRNTDQRNVCFKESNRKKMKKAGKNIVYEEIEL